MGGLVIETIRPGVQFTPEAANAFRRADAQVLAEFGRRISTNSTYRSWSDQMKMHTDWTRYVASGYKPSLKPNHSKAVHPSQSFHVSGTALDSNDWVNARIVQILADNGFIRNRLYVPNENHHFEYLRTRDKNYGKPAGGGSSTPAPTPAPAPKPAPIILEEDEDMTQVSKHPTKEEWTLHDPDVGLDLPEYVYGQPAKYRSTKVGGGVVNVFRGFMVTTDPSRGAAWCRTYCRPYGNKPQDRADDVDYKLGQAESSRLSVEKHRS